MTNATTPRGPDAASEAGAAGDLFYDAVVLAVVGGSVLALFFLAIDLLAGRGLFTPSLIGTVLFTGAGPASVTAIRLDMVAYFSIVHLLAFGGFSLAVAWLTPRLGLARRPPALLAGLLFGALTAGSLGVAALGMPGLVGVIGPVRIVAGNLLTAVAMTAVLRWAHRDDSARA